MRTPKEFEIKPMTARRVRADASAVIIMGALAAAATIGLAILKFAEVFARGGISWNLPVQAQPASAMGLPRYAQGGELAPAEITGTLNNLHVIVTDVNTVSTICLGASIAVAALAMLAVIACTMQLAWNFLRGDFFTRGTSVALRALTWAGAFGGLLAFIAWHLGSTGVEAAIGAPAANDGGLEWWSWYAIILFVLCASGLVDIAFRRAARLQRDQEGLI